MTIAHTDFRTDVPADAIQHINRLIEIGIDAEKDYGLAAADVRDEQLKRLFLRRERERAGFVTALQHVVHELGAFPENEGSAIGIAHRTWSALVRALTTRNDRTILEQCIESEMLALAVYDGAVRKDVFRKNRGLELMLRRQRTIVHSALVDLRTRLERMRLH
jgi:uncharacterized protein (TIGR02284 family)